MINKDTTRLMKFSLRHLHVATLFSVRKVGIAFGNKTAGVLVQSSKKAHFFRIVKVSWQTPQKWCAFFLTHRNACDSGINFVVFAWNVANCRWQVSECRITEEAEHEVIRLLLLLPIPHSTEIVQSQSTLFLVEAPADTCCRHMTCDDAFHTRWKVMQK